MSNQHRSARAESEAGTHSGQRPACESCAASLLRCRLAQSMHHLHPPAGVHCRERANILRRVSLPFAYGLLFCLRTWIAAQRRSWCVPQSRWRSRSVSTARTRGTLDDCAEWRRRRADFSSRRTRYLRGPCRVCAVSWCLSDISTRQRALAPR